MARTGTPLAIFAPIVGQHYHTYLKKEIETINPGGCVVIAYVQVSGPTTWAPECPILSVGKISPDELIPLSAEVATNAAMVPAKYREKFHTPAFEEKVLAFLEKHGVEEIFCEWMDIAKPLLELATRLQLPYTVRSHGTDITAAQQHRSYFEAYKEYNAKAKAVLAGSEFARKELHKAGIDDSKIVVVAPQGLDAKVGAESEPTRHDDRIVVLMLSRLEAMKGPIVALEAFRRAAAEVPNLYLECVGKGSMMQAVRQFVLATDLSERVNIRGFVDWEEAESLRSTSDIFLQASMKVPGEHAMETFGVSILEAMCHGMPVVCTRYQAFEELVRDGQTGFLVEEGNSAGLAEALVSLARDPQKRTSMRAETLKVVDDNFSVSKQRAKVRAVLSLDQVTAP